MRTLSRSYPYLWIANHYGVPYADVLACAAYLCRQTDEVPIGPIGRLSGPAHADVVIATGYFKKVQSGEIPFPPS